MSDTENSPGMSNVTEDELAIFDKWLDEPPETLISCLKDPIPDPPKPFKSGQRSRMFVNSNHASKNKANKDRKLIPGGYGNSWDMPIEGEDVPKVYVSDKEFHAALRTDRKVLTENSSGSTCSHFIVHSSCYCDMSCTVGVCTNCFMVFCNPKCLKDGLSDGGKIAKASKVILEESFGISKKVNPKKEVKKVEDSKAEIKKKEETEGNLTVTPKRTSPKGSPNSEIKSNPGLVQGIANISATKSARGRGKGAIKDRQESNAYSKNGAFVKEVSQNQNSKRYSQQGQSARPPPLLSNTIPPKGIFQYTNGYQPAYGEVNIVPNSYMGASSTTRPSFPEHFELGGKGHFERHTKGVPRCPSGHMDEYHSIIGASIGRGRGRILEQIPFYELVPQPGSGKVLRDPLASIYGERNDEPPVYRGRGRTVGGKYTKKPSQ